MTKTRGTYTRPCACGGSGGLSDILSLVREWKDKVKRSAGREIEAHQPDNRTPTPHTRRHIQRQHTQQIH